MTRSDFATMLLASGSSETAPDGSIVRPLLRVMSASMAHFELPAGGTSRAVMHESVDELWFVLSGRGELWRKQDAREEVVALQAGVCVTIPKRTHFQFRASRQDAVAVIAATIPGWPGDAEARFVRGLWGQANAMTTLDSLSASKARTRTASCCCGQLKIDVQGEPVGVGVCHCLACQQRTGSVFAAIAAFRAPYTVSGIATEFVRAGDQGARFRFRFCPVCGSNVFHTEEGRDGSVAVAVGAFADPTFPAPRDSVYECRRHRWMRLPDNVNAYERDPS